jgi:membrane-associated phospholipid phosphatase
VLQAPTGVHLPLSLMAAAEGFARVGIAVADAFIGCWQTKYTYNLLRPVTYLHAIVEPTWGPYLSTPAFPAYPSGHSTQSAAAAAALTAMFGIRAFTDTTHADQGLIPALEPRTFSSFDEAAEAAICRVYAGIHIPFGSQQGLVQGRYIGWAILDRVQCTKPRRGPG